MHKMNCIRASDRFLLRFSELALMNFPVDLTGLEEIIMLSNPCHLSVVHDDDLIGILKARRALGDDEDRRLLRKIVQRFPQGRIRRKIEGAEAVV